MLLARGGRVVRPMLASPGKTLDEAVKFAVDDNYELTPKMDGTRLLVAVDQDVSGWSRNGEAARIPAPIHAALQAVPGVVLDGELLGDVYVVFDAPTLPVHGPDAPLSERRSNLEQLFQLWNPGPHIRLCPNAVLLDDKADLIATVNHGRGEGLVAKHLNSPYTFGARTRDWIKLKRHHTIDCVVAWLGRDHGERHNMGLVVYRDGEPVDVGECGTLTGEGLHAQVGDVVEVRVLYASASGRLVQPTLPKLRPDKRPDECTWDQIEAAATNKNLVLEIT